MSRLAGDERGAIMILGVFFAVFLVGILFHVSAVAEAVSAKQHLQDSADVAAFGVAVQHARGMNLLVLLNQVMAALLAVLVGLRLVEMLAALGALVATGLAFTGAAVFAGPLHVVRQQAHSAYESLDSPVHGAIRALHATQGVLATAVPALAMATNAKASARSTTVVAPSRLSLPVEDDSYSVLCEKAGEDAGAVALAPFTALGLPGAIADPIESGIGDLAGSASDWFCGKSGAKPAKIERKVERVLPTLAARARCEAASGGADPGRTREECRDVESVEQMSAPDDRGACRTECGERGPYEERVQRARLECDPRRQFGLRGYHWSERTVRMTTNPRGETVRVFESVPSLVEMSNASPVFPCGARGARYGEGYERRVHRSAGDLDVLPVCSGAPKVLSSTLLEFVEVLQIFQCVVTETRVIDQGGQDRKAGDGEDEAPLRVPAVATAGSEAFQIRSASVLGPRSSWIERVVETTAWGRRVADAPSALLAPGHLAVAEAELGFDGKERQDEWMWHRRWTAHLSRTRAPTDQTTIAMLVGACAATESPKRCAGISLALGPLVSWVVH